MARFRIAGPAQIDLARILATSRERQGAEGRHRCAARLAAALRQVAAEPEGPLTRKRSDVRSGLRSFPVRFARGPALKVGEPVHVLYYRIARDGVIEIVRVLHERMDPSRHLEDSTSDDDA
jgi:toxin ParE1/3/4